MDTPHKKHHGYLCNLVMLANHGVFSKDWVWRFIRLFWDFKQYLDVDGAWTRSRGASHGWMQLSSLIVNVMKKTGHVAELKNPISGTLVKSVGSLFVDDANIFVYGDRKRYK